MLSVSRSFCARVPDLGRYQMTGGGLRLPKFGKGSKRAVKVAAATQAELPIPGVVVAVPAVGNQEVPRCGWWRRWVLALGRGWARLRHPGVQRRPRRQPVQTAFLLESVKVVRNDLVEADLELIRESRRRRGNGRMKKAAGGLPGGVEQRPGLGRVAVRWITAGRMH
jgi:hypothetical protein